jgi:hypothetical protein
MSEEVRKSFLVFENGIFDASTVHRIQKVEGGVAVFQIEPDGTIQKIIVKTEASIASIANQLRFE